MMILLQASLRELNSYGKQQLPDEYRVRPSHPVDIDKLGRLYFDAYDPDVGCATVEEAIDDIGKSFAGDYGDLWLDASPVVTFGDTIVGVVQTVDAAPWTDTPPGPFITECFVDRDHRRLGLARTLMQSAMTTMTESGSLSVSLRVRDSNSPARLLYASLGFRQIV